MAKKAARKKAPVKKKVRKQRKWTKLADQRQRVSHRCAVCEKEFIALKTAIYCSNACRQKAKYQRSLTAVSE